MNAAKAGRKNLFGEELLRHIARNNMDERMLAGKTGIRFHRIKRILHEPSYRPNLDTVLDIVDALRLDLVASMRFARLAGYHDTDKVLDGLLKRIRRESG